VSRQALEAVIGRAILDVEFRTALFADPDSTLVDYQLTAVELAALKSVDAESLDACGAGLAQRILKVLTHTEDEYGLRKLDFGSRGVV
jgi:hypothetical protein